MKVCVKSLLRPAHFMAFIFGFCPYRKVGDNPYRRSTLGTIFQSANVILMMSVQVGGIYKTIFSIPDHYSSLNKYSILIVKSVNVFFLMWLTVDRFVSAPKTLRCLRVADDLVNMIYQISNLKQRRTAFHFAMVWTIVYLIRLLRPRGIDFMEVTLFVTQFFTLYCETLALEFVTVICIALETINRTLKNSQFNGSCDINTLNKLQSLYLKAAYLSEVVNDSFGISWLISFFIKSIQIILLCYWILQLLGAAIDSDENSVFTRHYITYVYLIFRLVAAILRCFQICYHFDQPSAKRVEMTRILCQLITQSGDSEISIKMNEFNLQVALRKMEFTGGGFCDINLHYFVEILGTWFTLLVILVQATEVET